MRTEGSRKNVKERKEANKPDNSKGKRNQSLQLMWMKM